MVQHSGLGIQAQDIEAADGKEAEGSRPARRVLDPDAPNASSPVTVSRPVRTCQKKGNSRFSSASSAWRPYSVSSKASA